MEKALDFLGIYKCASPFYLVLNRMMILGSVVLLRFAPAGRRFRYFRQRALLRRLFSPRLLLGTKIRKRLIEGSTEARGQANSKKTGERGKGKGKGKK